MKVSSYLNKGDKLKLLRLNKTIKNSCSFVKRDVARQFLKENRIKKSHLRRIDFDLLEEMNLKDLKMELQRILEYTRRTRLREVESLAFPIDCEEVYSMQAHGPSSTIAVCTENQVRFYRQMRTVFTLFSFMKLRLSSDRLEWYDQVNLTFSPLGDKFLTETKMEDRCTIDWKLFKLLPGIPKILAIRGLDRQRIRSFGNVGFLKNDELYISSALGNSINKVKLFENLYEYNSEVLLALSNCSDDYAAKFADFSHAVHVWQSEEKTYSAIASMACVVCTGHHLLEFIEMTEGNLKDSKTLDLFGHAADIKHNEDYCFVLVLVERGQLLEMRDPSWRNTNLLHFRGDFNTRCKGDFEFDESMSHAVVVRICKATADTCLLATMPNFLADPKLYLSDTTPYMQGVIRLLWSVSESHVLMRNRRGNFVLRSAKHLGLRPIETKQRGDLLHVTDDAVLSLTMGEIFYLEIISSFFEEKVSQYPPKLYYFEKVE